MSMPLPARPVLKPALRRVWRDGDVLQLGVDPQHAVVLTGVGAAELRLLDLLDGTRQAGALLAAAAAGGLDVERAEQLVMALSEAGLIDDAAPDPLDEHERQRLLPDRLSLSVRHHAPGAADLVLLRRRQAGVVVHGAGRVGAAVAGLLAAAGVGRLGCADDGAVRPADLTPVGIPVPAACSRAAATVRRLQRVVPSAQCRIGAVPEPTLAVLAPTGRVPTPDMLAAVRQVPHLLVAVRETTAAVGPLVLPGVTPCIRCLELGRGERDRDWPTIAAQLAWSPRSVEPCDVALASLAASLASLHVLGWIDTAGESAPPSSGGIVEFDLLDGRLRRRTVAAHPACGCGAAA
jgi:bacteriocin biosynthesis cyclodehydratase domain-containing protein